jgi:general L-amino acid transport system permease protein
MSETTQRAYPVGQHPDLPPPASAVGWRVWIWKNLFGTVTNTTLTLLSIFLIYSIVPFLAMHFVVNSVVFDGITVGQLFIPSTYAQYGEGSIVNYLGALIFFALMLGAIFYKGLPWRTVSRYAAIPFGIIAVGFLMSDITLPVADSRVACRETSDGACWAVIVERFRLSLYYQYPVDERYRLNLAFVLLFVALGPLLFDRFPWRRQMFWFSAAFPFIATLLVIGPIAFESLYFQVETGGSGATAESRSGIGPYIWITVLAAGIVMRRIGLQRGLGALSGLGVVLTVVPIIVFLLSDQLWIHIPDAIGLTSAAEGIYIFQPVTTDRFGGIMLTIIIGVTGITLSLPLGILLALGRTSNLPALKVVCVVFIEFIRGVPLIALLFVASTMLNYFLPPGVQFDLLLRVLIMVVLFASAYIAEVVRGGLQAIPKGQYEAADAMGLTYWQAMRLIILPQALKISIPGIVNTFIGLYKDTTLVIIIGLFDLLGVMRASLSDPDWNGLSMEVYIYTSVFFFLCCFAMSRYSIWLENKLHTGHKR